MNLYKHEHNSPIGPLTLVASDRALVGVYMATQKHPPSIDAEEAAAHPLLARAARQLDEYFAGRRTSFDLPLDPQGTDHQRAVWEALQAIPYGETRSYGEIAAAIGRPRAARAIGAANGRNPISIIVPCHRVIGADGSLTVGSSRVDLQACKLEYSIVSPK